MTNMATFKIATIIVCILTLTFALTPAANAQWYDVKIIVVAPKTDTGDVAVQIQDVGTDASLDHFTGIQRCWVFNSDPGANKVMASLLTALSANLVTLVNIDGVPTWNNGLVCKSAGVRAP